MQAEKNNKSKGVVLLEDGTHEIVEEFDENTKRNDTPKIIEINQSKIKEISKDEKEKLWEESIRLTNL